MEFFELREKDASVHGFETREDAPYRQNGEKLEGEEITFFRRIAEHEQPPEACEGLAAGLPYAL